MSAAIVAGRYRIEGAIAQGGMGEVLAVLDQSTGRRLALKRMLDASNARLTAMFAREYHTLVRLRHPRIIEVYDYGVDLGRPYYTMELLDGADLRKQAPLPYRRACAYLRDIASSLALLHARRLLHRDISPRNVRVTSDGRCKLIDFGTLATFGVPEVVAGTPPFIAPEALQATELDQRADLFALGAVGYWLLTGTNAFPARTVPQLPDLWRTNPKAPSELAAQVANAEQWLEPIPAALDDLILSLLARDPLGRPASAVEVIERLTTLADLEPDHDELSARSYLHASLSVGREREREVLRATLQAAIAGTGSAVVIEAPAGMGSSHLVSALAIEAQLAGATPIIVDARAHRGVYGLVHALIDKLVVALPSESLEAAALKAGALSRFSPLLASRLTHAPSSEVLPPGELRRRTQAALGEWLIAISVRQPILLAIDNLQAADEASAALMASLAGAAKQHALMLLATCTTDVPATAAAALRAWVENATRLPLPKLTRDETHALVCSLFGAVEGTARLAEWLHRLAAGSPRASMQLVQHLVDRRVIRFVEGVWVLPQQLSPEELPASLDDALDARLDRLSEDARRLAEALSVHRGAVPIEQCIALAEHEALAAPLSALDELTEEEILVQAGTSYRVAHDSVRTRLYARLGAERKRSLHQHVGRLLAIGVDSDVDTMLDAGWHLLQGGAESEGAELLARAGTLLAEAVDELPAAIPALRAALEIFRAQGRSERELIRLIGPLAVAGYRVDRRLAIEYGDEAIASLQRLIGLTLAARLRPLLGRHLSLYLGLGAGLVRSLAAHGLRGFSELHRLLSLFFLCVSSLAGTATICMDVERARRYSRAVEPLTALGKDHAATIAFELTRLLALLPEDRLAEVADACERLAARLEDTTRPIRGLPPESRALIHGGVYYALGALSCFRDGPKALHCAERLEALGLKMYAIAADQVRTTYHALRGEMIEAKRFRERVEMHALQAGTGWQVEIWAPSASSHAYTLTRDVIGTKAVAEVLDRIAAEVPTFQRHAQIARCTFYQRKGKYQMAYELRRAVLGGCATRGFIGWSAATGSQVQALVALGRFEEAKRLAQVLLDSMTPADEPYFAMYQQVYIGLTDADLALGRPIEAKQRIDALITQHAPNEGPLTLGCLHTLGLRVAIALQDTEAARCHLEQMERWYRPTGNPALISQCERGARELRRFLRAIGALPSSLPPGSADHGATTKIEGLDDEEDEENEESTRLEDTLGSAN